MVEHQLPKLRTWVRFPSPAPIAGDYLIILLNVIQLELEQHKV